MPKLFKTVAEAAEGLESYIRGKTVMITGGTVGGLGLEAALSIAKHSPALLIVTNRSQEKADEALAAIKAEAPSANTRSLLVDLSSLDSVRKAAVEINSWSETIEVLIHNAGVAGMPLTRTKDGLEMTFAVNHVGPFLLTKLIIPKMLASREPPRIVVVSSSMHNVCNGFRWDDPNYLKEDEYKFSAYPESKVLNILFASALARRSRGRIQALSVTPGWVITGLSRHLSLDAQKRMGFLDEDGNPDPTGKSSKQDGCVSYIVGAFDPKVGELANGGFLGQFGEIAQESVADFAKGEDLENKMWALSELSIGEKFEL